MTRKNNANVPAFRRAIVWLASLALLAVACGGSAAIDTASSDTEDRAETTETTETETTEAPETTDEAETEPEPESVDETDAEPEVEPEPAEVTVLDDLPPIEIVLLDAGAEPRIELRLQAAPTCSEIVTVNQVQELNQNIGGSQVPTDGAVGTIIEMLTTSTPNGDNFDVRSEITGAMADGSLAPELAAQINTAMLPMVGLTTFQTLTNRAELVPGSSRVEGAEALGPLSGLLDGLNQSQAPFPEEAVGVGARWQTTAVLMLQGLPVTNITETEIISIDGTLVEMVTTGTQEVPPNSVMSLQGINAEVLVWEAPSTGTVLVDLARISPIQSLITTMAIQELDFESTAGGLLEQQINSEVTITSTGTGCTGSSLDS